MGRKAVLIGSIPHGWESVTLGEIIKRGGGSIQTGPFGSQLHASDYVPVGVPSIMPVNIGDNRLIEDGIARITEADAKRLARHRVKSGDIIYSRRGDVERRAIIRKEHEGWLCGTGCLKVRFGDGAINSLFASYYLGHPDVRAWIVQHAVGATMPNLNTSIMEQIPFLLPPLKDQQAIAHILGILDDKIELNRRMNETLEAMARAIFKSWFVDFDPVHAKMKGQKPEAMDPATAKLFPDSFEDSALGLIPKGWKVCPFADTIDIIGGGTPKTSVDDYWNGSIPWFSVVDAPSDSDVWVVNTEKKITSQGVENSSTRVLPVGTTIISARGTVGRIALVGIPMAMNQSCYGLRGRVGPHGYYTYFSTRELVASLQQHAHGSVFDTITRDTLAGVSVALPDSRLVQFFEDRTSPLLHRILASILESRALAALRDTLLPKLLSGEIHVADVDKIIART